MPLTTIETLQNPRIKRAKALMQKRNRDREGLFILEGERELDRGIQAGVEATQIMLCPELFRHGSQSEANHHRLLKGEVPVVYLAKKVFEHCSYRENPDGFLAVCKTFERHLNDLRLPSNPTLLILESVEKPGNLGTILRTADATGIDALILNEPVTDLFNPNVIRASAGVVFNTPAITATPSDTIDFLKSHDITAFATTPGAARLYYEAVFSGPTAIVLGSEKDGLSDFWIRNCGQKIALPMHGQSDSLNVSATAATILYEIVRQRA